MPTPPTAALFPYTPLFRSVQQLLGGLGIAVGSTVVAYDNGTLLSARLWWILHYFGHENVHILDGGLPAWQAMDGEEESGGHHRRSEEHTSELQSRENLECR